MFESLNLLPPDPILGLMDAYKKDSNPNKVDLGVGVYRNDAGQTPVLKAVREAEAQLIARQTTKVYVGPAGNVSFNEHMLKLLLGASHGAVNDGRVCLLQTPGGCGALRVAAELIKSTSPGATVWVSDPTWGNHIPLLGGSGLQIRSYPYYDAHSHCVDFDAMLSALNSVAAGDLVLLHGCCHNPSGADLSKQQWQQVAECAQRVGFIPFVDIAYQGFGEGVEQDAYGLRLLAESLPEVIFAASCSKNFGLYRERAGVVGLVGANAQATKAGLSQFLSIVRGFYSMPPDHGAAIVANILASEHLTQVWTAELETMRARIKALRGEFSQRMAQQLGRTQFDFVAKQTGMFSFLGLSEHQVALLAARYGIYALGSSRVSIAGLTPNNIQYVCQSVVEIVG